MSLSYAVFVLLSLWLTGWGFGMVWGFIRGQVKAWTN